MEFAEVAAVFSYILRCKTRGPPASRQALRRAEAAFLRVLEIDPADHYARFALGRTLQRQSRLEEARAQLRMAAAMTPRPEYQEALGEVSASIAVRRGA